MQRALLSVLPGRDLDTRGTEPTMAKAEQHLSWMKRLFLVLRCWEYKKFHCRNFRILIRRTKYHQGSELTLMQHHWGQRLWHSEGQRWYEKNNGSTSTWTELASELNLSYNCNISRIWDVLLYYVKKQKQTNKTHTHLPAPK